MVLVEALFAFSCSCKTFTMYSIAHFVFVDYEFIICNVDGFSFVPLVTMECISFVILYRLIFDKGFQAKCNALHYAFCYRRVCLCVSVCVSM